ncbi:MAG: 50S ribosomal protein L24 [Puniceicoccales bacterium]|jgi:large subunit ribosomal protein L24|nr:50S ribosomal protein L24 [Puniceicoccales bacterium]
MKAFLRIGDEVEVIAGNGRGMQGKICCVLDGGSRFRVSGVRPRKVYVKKSAKHPEGGILEIEAPIHQSNLRKISSKKKIEIC